MAMGRSVRYALALMAIAAIAIGYAVFGPSGDYQFCSASQPDTNQVDRHRIFISNIVRSPDDIESRFLQKLQPRGIQLNEATCSRNSDGARIAAFRENIIFLHRQRGDYDIIEIDI